MPTERRNITQPTDWWAAFAEQAEAERLTLSEWIGAACVRMLPVDVRRGLSERTSRGRPANEEGNDG